MHRPALLLQILAVLAGCRNPNGPLVDGTACLAADSDAPCPAIEDVEAELLGDHCTAIVEKITGEGVHTLLTDWWDSATEPYPGCCYPTKERRETGCVDGRPLRIDDAPLLAPTVCAPGWALATDIVVPAEVAAAWARAASYEHASIAAFARIVLELLGFGAPATLVVDAQRALGDEIRHATCLFGLASAHGDVGPGPLPLPAALPLSPDLAAFAADCVREGCVGETIAAALMAASARAARDPSVRSMLSGIADDESRHAALSWRLAQWAMAVGGRPVADAVDAAFADALEGTIRVEGGVDREDLAQHGRLGPAATRAVVTRTIAEVIRPAWAVLRAPEARAA